MPKFQGERKNYQELDGCHSAWEPLVPLEALGTSSDGIGAQASC